MGHKSASAILNFNRSITNLLKGDFKDAGKFVVDSIKDSGQSALRVSGLRAAGKFIKPDFPETPISEVPDPVGIPETGGDSLDALRRRRRRSGRADTIRAGSLIPEDVGTKSLLG